MISNQILPFRKNRIPVHNKNRNENKNENKTEMNNYGDEKVSVWEWDSLQYYIVFSLQKHTLNSLANDDSVPLINVQHLDLLELRYLFQFLVF